MISAKLLILLAIIGRVQYQTNLAEAVVVCFG